MDPGAAQIEALRRIRAVCLAEPVPAVPAAEATDVAVAIGEVFGRMREEACRASSAWALVYVEGELARLMLTFGEDSEDD